MNVCLIGGPKRQPIISEVVRDLESPNVLIIPSACSTEESYSRKVANTLKLFQDLGLPSVVLHGFNEAPTKTELEEKFGQSSAVYVIGGNSPIMMKSLSEHGTDHALRQAIEDRKLYMGTSAGALALFNQGLINPSPEPKEEIWDYEILNMLGVIPTIATAHASTKDPRRRLTRLEHLERRLPKNTKLGLGIDEGAALVIKDGASRTLRSNPSSNVHVVERDSDGVQSRAITDNEELTELVQSL